MTSDNTTPSRQQLEAAIDAQEGLRDTLGDAVVDATIAALRNQLAQLTEVEQQRKLVTVLFMDVVGSTHLMRGRDPEETMAIMDAALARLAVPIGEHGGRVTRFMGDGFMAVFGLPTARENDPEMAIRSGLAILDESTAVATELESSRSIQGFTVRVGINTGLVVTGGVTEAEDTIMGDAVNLAARLESAAPPGGVLISRDTRQHVRGLFEIADGGTIDAKGFQDPVPVYRVIGRAGSETRRSERGIEGLEIPMIGRELELGVLLDAVEAAATGGLQTVTIVGEAGLGKSRLLKEARARLGSFDLIRWDGRAMLETRDLPYALIRNLVEQRYGIRNDDGAVAVRHKLVTGVASDLANDPDAEQKAHFIGQLIGYEFASSPHVRSSLEAPQQIRSRAVMYLSDVISAVASRAPVVIAVEDLHWADAGSLDVLDGAIASLADQRVLMVAAARPSLRERRPDWGQWDHHRWIRLEPLSASQSQELTAAALRRVVDCPEDLRNSLVEHAGGNPYYLEETIRMLVEDGVINPGDDIWTVDRERLPEMRIPATLSGVIQARLDGLSRSERTALQRASVVGRVFWDATVEHLATDTAEDSEVVGTLNSLGRRDMVHQRDESEFSDAAEYRFHHEILRAVTYESVLLRVRRTYHSLVAEWLIARSGDRATELTGLIAGHLEDAGRNLEALEYFSAAAETALAAYAVETADGYYARALSLAPADDSERRFALLLGRAKTLGMRGLTEEQAAALNEVATLAGNDHQAIAAVAIEQAWLYWFRGDFEQAISAAGSAVESAKQTGDPALESRTRLALSMSLLGDGKPDAALPEADLSLQLAHGAGDKRALARARNALGLIALADRDLSAARHHLTASLDISRQLGNLERELTAANNLGIVEAQLGNYTAARGHFDRFRQIAAEVGDRFSESSGVINLAWVAASDASWSLARDLAERAVTAKREFGHTDAVAEGLMWLGHALHGLGDEAAARNAYSEALQIREELGQAGLAMGARAGVARTALAMGDVDTAEAQAMVVCRYLDEGGSLTGAWEPLRIHLTCGDVLRATGNPDGERVLARARDVLMADADRIADPVDRRSFLERVPWHRRILELSNAPTDS